jgi:hypothetical protein
MPTRLKAYSLSIPLWLIPMLYVRAITLYMASNSL